MRCTSMSSKCNILSIWRELDILNPKRLLARLSTIEFCSHFTQKIKLIIEQIDFPGVFTNNNELSLALLPINSSHSFLHLVKFKLLSRFCIKNHDCSVISTCNKFSAIRRPSFCPQLSFKVRLHYCLRLFLIF